MKDLFGRTLEIGDIVAFNPPTYKGLVSAKVIGFTPKMVKLEFKDSSYSYTKTLSITNVWPHDTSKRV